MCFICNDTKTVYVPGSINKESEFSIAVDCPICYEQSRYEKSVLEDITDSFTYAILNNKEIDHIILTRKEFNKLKAILNLDLYKRNLLFSYFNDVYSNKNR